MTFDAAWVREVFERRLPLAGYAVREGQVAMAGYAHLAFAKRRHLLAEAGVGTGKTFAYLVPAIALHAETGATVLIATHTIALQEQIVAKDVPALARVLGVAAPVVLAKGRDHSMCRARLRRLAEGLKTPDASEQRLLDWGGRSMTGDRADCPGIADALWARVNWGQEGPCAAACRFQATCPSHAVRRRWKSSEGLIVTNHHQFFADMALRSRGQALFPTAGAIVLDEAHAIPDAAREMLGDRASQRAIAGAFKAARARLGEPSLGPDPGEALFAMIAARAVWQADEETDAFALAIDADLTHAAAGLVGEAERLHRRLAEGRGNREASERLLAAVAAVRVLQKPDTHVTWVAGDAATRQVAAVRTAPTDLAGILGARLFGRGVPVVLTSATLATEGDFGYMERVLGVDKPLRCIADSPFDFERQARLYVAEDLPDPTADSEVYYAAALDRLESLLAATRGRALVLFTARSRVRAAFERLQGRLSVPLYMQDRADPRVLDRFVGETDSVLLGTAYWTGVDVPGESLSCVVIVKLPFPPPEPVLAARMADAARDGRDPFEAVLLPEMLLRLKQGAGRAIRHETDRAVIAILDPRAATRTRYAAAVADALPPAPRVRTLAEVATFLAPKGAI